MLRHDPQLDLQLLADVAGGERREVIEVHRQHLRAFEADAPSADVEKPLLDRLQRLVHLRDLAGVGVNDAHLVLGFGRDPFRDLVGEITLHVADVRGRLAGVARSKTQNESLGVRGRTDGERACHRRSNDRR